MGTRRSESHMEPLSPEHQRWGEEPPLLACGPAGLTRVLKETPTLPLKSARADSPPLQGTDWNLTGAPAAPPGPALSRPQSALDSCSLRRQSRLRL